MSHGTFRLQRLALGLAAACGFVYAQEQLEPVTVTGNALRSIDAGARVSTLDGDALVLQRGGTLAETLRTVPGVSSTWFGPNANRPVIRGLDGDRIRMLANSGTSLDASSLSFDHAVPIDPLIARRIEVLRGPSALLYGGNAIGGVVNTIDNRIPSEPITGLGGAAEVRFGGAASERGGAALVEAGNGRFALHADVYGRRTSDLRVPRYTPIEDGTPLPETDRVRNSASRTRGGALGVSTTFDGGHVGISADRYDSRYGIVVEPGIIIDMVRDHVAAAGEWRSTDGPLRALRARLGGTRYEHREIEETGAVGTTFETDGQELRLEAEHAPLAGLRGVIGVQWEDFDFSALGEEAFVPSTRTKRAALFAVEQWAWAPGPLEFGARIERAEVASAGDADPLVPQFGPAQTRRFTPRSVSIAQTLQLDTASSVAATLSHTERAPTSFELFANGVHAATGAFERGDPGLDLERGTQIDLGARWRGGAGQSLRANVFAARFSRYIALDATGQTVAIPDGAGGFETFPEYTFVAVPARLLGFEIEGSTRLVARPWALDLSGSLEAVRGSNRASGEPLPRIAPARARVALDAAHAGWGARAEVIHAARQSRVPADDVATPSYTLLNMALSRRVRIGEVDALGFVALDNIADRLATNAASIRTVRELAPLPGRSLKVGWRMTY